MTETTTTTETVEAWAARTGATEFATQAAVETNEDGTPFMGWVFFSDDGRFFRMAE